MSTRTRIFVTFLACALSFGLPALAAEETLVLDPATTEVSFLLEATGSDVEGRLYLRSGEIRFDPATGDASGGLEIDALRSATGHAKRDKAMHKKVLESERHPLISFRAERLEGSLAASGTSEVKLHGTVTLLGQEHPLTLPLAVEIDGVEVRARTTFPVPYVEWGLRDPSLFVLRVAKVVDVTVAAAGKLGTADAAPATSER